MTKPGNATFQKEFQQIRKDKISGKLVKRFQDEFFALDLLKILYDDEVEVDIKNELLIALEEFGHYGIDEESVDQIITSLIDIFHQSGDREQNWSFGYQLLITCTSLLIQLDQLNSDVCTNLVTELVTLISSRVNQPDSRRIRSSACQCLIQLEEFHSGLLFSYLGDFSRLAKQERTDVYQDYALLTAKVMESVGMYVENGELKSPSYLEIQKPLQKQISLDSQEFRQIASYIVESCPLFTQCGTFRIMESLSRLVQTLPTVSPMIFKPFMLHQMSTMSCIYFHSLIHLQREFEGEILSEQEEADLLARLVRLVNHPSLIPSYKLIAIQWTQYYQQLQEESDELPSIHDEILSKHRLEFYPRVFDTLSCQLAKLYMTSLCGNTGEDQDGIETSILLGSLGCLHKLVWHTGSGRPAIALFRALFFIYRKHNSPSFSQDIQRFVRGLISEFAHFIPHSIDFMECIKASFPDSPVYLETLTLIHQQVVMATEDQILDFFQYYLQIMKKAAMEKEIWQNPTLKFLHYLAEHAAEIDNSSWKLGHTILDICRNLLIYHGTEHYYTDLGDLLYYMMTEYQDIDVQDKARFYYALLTGAADKKIHHVLQDTMFGAQTVNQALSTILPGNTEKKNLAKILHMDSPIFSWERINVSASCTEISDEHGNLITGTPTHSGRLKDYYGFLRKNQTSIDLNFKLTLMSDSEFTKVHAVTVHVVVDSLYHKIPDTHVACLNQSECRDIVIKLCPKLPLPHSLQTSVVFASDQKQTYSHKLPNIDVEFSHLLLPLPWKQPTGSDLIQFFQELWDWILKPSQPERKGVQSVKLLELSMNEFKALCQQKLLQYVILDQETDQVDTRLAMFLPPQYHILMKCQGQQDRVVVTMVTDLWNILIHIDQFLESLINKN